MSEQVTASRIEEQTAQRCVSVRLSVCFIFILDMEKQRSARQVTRVQPCIGSRSAEYLLWHTMVHHSRCVVSLLSLVLFSPSWLISTRQAIRYTQQQQPSSLQTLSYSATYSWPFAKTRRIRKQQRSRRINELRLISQLSKNKICSLIYVVPIQSTRTATGNPRTNKTTGSEK